MEKKLMTAEEIINYLTGKGQGSKDADGNRTDRAPKKDALSKSLLEKVKSGKVEIVSSDFTPMSEQEIEKCLVSTSEYGLRIVAFSEVKEEERTDGADNRKFITVKFAPADPFEALATPATTLNIFQSYSDTANRKNPVWDVLTPEIIKDYKESQKVIKNARIVTATCEQYPINAPGEQVRIANSWRTIVFKGQNVSAVFQRNGHPLRAPQAVQTEKVDVFANDFQP